MSRIAIFSAPVYFNRGRFTFEPIAKSIGKSIIQLIYLSCSKFSSAFLPADLRVRSPSFLCTRLEDITM